MNNTRETYAAGLSRNHAFDALPRSNDEQEKTRMPKITTRRVVYYFIWAMIQLTVLIYKIYQGSKVGDALTGYNKGVEALMMTCLSTNFFLMAPTLMRMLRTTPLRRIICFDKTIHAHKVVAYSLVFWMAQHVVARYYKFYTIQVQSNGK
ncbi:hypothetical protein H4S00_005433, partial [Coemansia sp. D1744]